MSDAVTGGCLCGAVRYTLSKKPDAFGACHCNMCRRWTGGIELGVQVMPGDITFDDETHIKPFKSSDWAERAFCDTCGTSLYWRLTAPGAMHGMMALSAGSLDSLEGMVLDHEVYVDHKPAAYEFAGDRKQMTEADVMAMVQGSLEGDAQ
ncbi:GFA family protein [Litoreibacter roseus]|uniref:Aldehyde-activating protein n=1 Tax=Litoreibacter roseus TaxID=2601869 RepID=A0A6N6JGS4_9RHOB|nr:GFA family protein [Litoreibacter roseus]GFE64589.1 aldehyde-activating protein [Litoreibacter roseus]